MSLKHSSEVKLALARKSPRIWLDNRVRLLDSGFVPGCHYMMTTKDGKIELILSDVGDRTVSYKEKNGSILPVVDINTKDILKSFPAEMIGQQLYARFYDGKIVITVLPTQEAVCEREDRFMDELKTEKGLSKVSLFTGSGFLDNAIATGLKNAGINSHCVFANELDDRYISNGLENNSALSGATTVQGSIASLHRFDIPQASMMIMGSPCVGFSKSGKSKNGIDSELLHKDAGHLFMYMVAVVLRVNPAIVIFENTPEAMDSVTFSLIEKMMVEQGYKIQKQVIDSRFFGSLEQRKRMAFVAVSEGLDVDTSLLKETGEPVIKVGDVMDAQIDESDWSPMTYLFEKQERDIVAGKGFRMHIVDADSDRVSTIGKAYQKNRSTETKVRHPEVEGLYRLFTPAEHARIKGFNPDMVRGLPKTTAHEVLGNGVVANGFIALAELIGHQVGGVSKSVAPSSQSRFFEPETVEIDQKRTVSKSAPVDELQLSLFS